MAEIIYIVTCLLFIPTMIYGIYAQISVNTTFSKYNNMQTRRNKTAHDIAKEMLIAENINDVEIQQIKGHLTDNYNPKNKILSLSKSTYNSTSVASIGVAAHEVGHAIQHENGYKPFKIRSILVPIVNFSNFLFFPLLVIGFVLFFLSQTISQYGEILIWISVGLYSFSTIFYLVTVPLEFHASKKALENLQNLYILDEAELKAAKKVLKAAARTYLASLVMSILQLLRFASYIFILIGRRRD